MSRVIEVIVSTQVRLASKPRGFSGSTCREASRFIEHALGKVASQQLSSEYYRQTEAESLRQQQ